jgi:hypothetical protein
MQASAAADSDPVRPARADPAGARPIRSYVLRQGEPGLSRDALNGISRRRAPGQGWPGR